MTSLTNRGFFHNPDADPAAYIFGQSPIQADILAPDRDWSKWLPKEEIQTRGWDTLACASFNTLTSLEILILRQYGVERNYSDRYLAYVTDTHKKGGNDPHYVCEVLRRNGDVQEEEWPFLPAIDTFEKYYAAPPTLLYDLARDFLKEWTVKHDTVKATREYPLIQEAMWDALQYSPLGCSVGINSVDENGYWFKSGGFPDSHWTVIIGGEYGKYFLVFDSAEPVFKKLAWDKLNPMLVKRYAVFKAGETPEELSLIIKILTAIRDWWIGYRKTNPLPTIPQKPLEPLPPRDAGMELYEAAVSMIGKNASPDDFAPDELACVESLQNVVHAAFDEFIEPYTLSTTTLVKNLRNSPDWIEVKEPSLGCIAVFPTQGKTVGHCGVWGKTHVMSNNSAGKDKGLWTANYTHASWRAAAKARGLQNLFFERI